MATLERPDDDSIPDTERLWRRVHPSQLVRRAGERARPQSSIFVDGNTGELSVHLASLTSLEGICADFPSHSIAEVSAGEVRALSYRVCRDPVDDDPCPFGKRA